ncbi:MAG: ABC transporter substrate-binding protein [Chloroflexota bacterium]|nr:ABC transporter substrate-binding protein [Chloroflexota bacterium]
MTSDSRMTRRRVLGLAAALGLGATGAAALAACGDTQVVQKIVTVEVERIVEKVVTREVERVVEKVVTVEVERIVEVPIEKQDTIRSATVRPQPTPFRQLVAVEYMTDHISGARGRALQWGLERFELREPNVHIRIHPSDFRYLSETLDALDEFKWALDLMLFGLDRFLDLHAKEVFTEVTELLPKMLVVKEDYYFVPDSYTYNNVEHSFPQPSLMEGPQFGMPFQMAISGFVANASLAESVGVTLPSCEDSWTWDDWTEWDAEITDPETGTFGTLARDDYVYQYMPQMYSAGLIKPFDDGLTQTMFDQPQALRAWEYLINKIHVQKTSPRLEQVRVHYDSHADTFYAGVIGIFPSARAALTGYGLARIKSEFEWALLPAVAAPGGAPAAHGWSGRSNLVTHAASSRDVREESMALAVYLAGEEYQRRVGIERGHMPVHKAALAAPESLAPPPQGMKWLKYYADRPDNRSLFPFSTWREWYNRHRELARKGWTGEQTPEEALEACQAWGVEHLSTYEGPRPYVREPVYP